MEPVIVPSRIVRYPDPRLRQVCARVERFDERLESLVQRLLDLMREGNGVGLAAPQGAISQRIFVCNPTGEPAEALVFINPELFDLSGSVEAEEGCLSLPEIRVHIRRARRCRIRAQDVKGKPFELEGEDLPARIWQHETDHLDGRLIIDRMDATDRIANKKQIAQLEADYRKATARTARGSRKTVMP
jgi:peptide deformylase